MTGRKFGAHPEAWRRWWAAQQEKLLGGGLPPRSDEEGGDEGDRKQGHFYGIPQVSLKERSRSSVYWPQATAIA